MQKARGQIVADPKVATLLPPLVGTRFQGLFHPPPGVLFTFPSRYSFTIGHRLVFRLGRWSCQIQSGFLVSRFTQVRIPGPAHGFVYGAITLYGLAFQPASTPHAHHPEDQQLFPDPPYNPARATAAAFHAYGLGSSPFARRYSGNHCCFLFLEVLRCFSSLGSLPRDYFIHLAMTGHYPGRVPPFGHPGINARVQLPLAFRSLPRPSSPVCA